MNICDNLIGPCWPSPKYANTNGFLRVTFFEVPDNEYLPVKMYYDLLARTIKIL